MNPPDTGLGPPTSAEQPWVLGGTEAAQHRRHALTLYQKLTTALHHLPTAGSMLETLIHRLQREAITGLMEDLQAVLNGACPHDPRERRGEAIGMYHCPLCGCMVLAGVETHPHQGGCRFGLASIVTFDSTQCHEPDSRVQPGEPA